MTSSYYEYVNTFYGHIWSPVELWHLEAQATLDEYHKMRAEEQKWAT